MRRLSLLLFVLLALIAASCGSDDDTTAEPTITTTTEGATTTTTEVVEPTTTTTEAAEPTTTAEAAAPAWMQVAAPDCECADGSDYSYWVRDADPEHVVLFFDGGGACFSAATCDPNGDPTYTIRADDDPNRLDSGIFALDNPANPLADWTMIFMPYCTGDVHIGTNVNDYGDGVVISHTGFINASKGLDELVASYGDAAQVLVTGSSAGGVPSPLFGGLVADALPDADVMVLADASGGYPSNPALNPIIGALWGTEGAIPEWASTTDATSVEFGIPDLYVYAGSEFPSLRFARYDNADDEVQSSFSSLAGLEDSSVRNVLAVNETLVEDAGIELDVYVAPGTAHTILGRDAFYTLEVGGVGFADWLADFVAGQPIDDVVCDECGVPAS